MGVLFEAGDVVVWSPSPRLARLFLAQVRALEELVGKQSGIGEIVADEVRVDPAALNAFVAAVADALSSTTNATMRSLMAGPFSMAAGLSSACGYTTSSMSGIAGELARRGAELVTGRGDLRSYDTKGLSEENIQTLNLVQAMVGAVSSNLRWVTLEVPMPGAVRSRFVLEHDDPDDREEIADIGFELEALQTSGITLDVDIIVDSRPIAELDVPGRVVFGRKE